MGLHEVFIKFHSRVVDNDDDRLCWYSFLVLCLYLELRDTKKFNIKNRTQKTKAILLAERGINYSNLMTQADKKPATAVFNDFQGMKQYDMRDDAFRRHLNISLFDYNEKYQMYDLIKAWVGNPTNTEHHNALIYSYKHNIHIMLI